MFSLFLLPLPLISKGMNKILRPFINKTLFGLSKFIIPESLQVRVHLLH